MALTDCLFEWPSFMQGGPSNAAAMDASGEACAYIIQIPKTGTITKVGILTGAVTTSDSLSVRLETLDASGHPNNTVYGSCAAGTQASVAASTLYEVTLGTSCTATQGDFVAVTIRWTSYVAGNLQLTHGGNQHATGLPCIDNYTTSWSKAAQSPTIWLVYDDSSVPCIVGSYPYKMTQATYHSGSAIDERALYISAMPFGARTIGLVVRCAAAGASGDFDAILYDSGSTAQRTTSVDASNLGSTGTTTVYTILWSSPYTLTSGSAYRVALKPTTTNTLNYQVHTVFSTAVWSAVMGGIPGTVLQNSTRADGGAWTNTDTERPRIGLLLDQIDVSAAAGGGLLTHPGMAGGMRG